MSTDLLSPEGDLDPAEPRPRRRGSHAIELGYAVAIILAELVGLRDPLLSGVCQGVLLVVLINHYAMSERDERQPLLLAMAVVCLYRVLALTPLSGGHLANRLAVIGVPALLAAVLAMRLLGYPGIGGPLPDKPSSGAVQLVIGLLGVPLSYAAYKLLKPTTVVTFSGNGHTTLSNVITAVTALVVFSGLTEELLFRGLLHSAARATFGPLGLYVSSLLFAAAYIGTRSAAFVLFALAVGAFFGWCAERSDSIIGVVLAHAVISVGAFVVWPSLASSMASLHL
ncbi:MAG TPA: type II CAAX endopeptidase family protein [Actinomycetota bacterium]|nr:type II CAAX endopeptidase family protein [Actinomycetota bacterium]